MKTNSNILIIANKKIFPTLDGGAMAMKKMSELLLAQNYKVDIVCISKQNKPSKANNPIIKKIDSKRTQFLFEKKMQINFFQILHSIITNQSYQTNRFYDKKIRNFIQNLIYKNQYKIIIFESIFSTVYLNKIKIKKNTKTILRVHNIEHQIWKDLSKSNYILKIPYLLLSNQIKKIENSTPKKLDYIFTLSEFDKDYFMKLFPKKTHNFPVTFSTQINKNSKIKNSIFHLGAMDWKPNIEGVEWFLNYILPKIHYNNNNIKIFLAGKNMPKKYFSYNNKEITIEDQIENAEEYIKNKEIMIVPLFSGSGIRIKILEGMSFGIPIISTSKGAEGIPYTNKKNIIIADTPSDFENAIYLLINNKELAKEIGENGKKLINTYFSKDAVINKWKKIIN